MTLSKNLKKLVVIAILAVAITTPVVLQASAQESNNEIPTVDVEADVVTQGPPLVFTEETPVIEEVTPPVVETTVEEEVTPPVVEEVVEETEEPVVEEEVTVAVSIVEAIEIAQAEHPDVEVIKAKVSLKLLDGEKVFKVAFADGWRIYVRASDGEIVRIKDASDTKHNCGDRGRNAVNNWRKNHRKSDRREYSRKTTGNWSWSVEQRANVERHKSHR